MEKQVFRGVETFWEIIDGQYYCHITINKPFFYKGSQYYSLSDKLIEACVTRNATIIAKVAGQEFRLHPTKKTFREKKKAGMIEFVKSKFPNYPDWYRVMYPYENSQTKLL